MAEYCLSCFNKMNSTHLTDKQVKLSKGLELCEGCGQYKIVVVKIKLKNNPKQ